MLVFDEQSHSYQWNGKPVPSVTQIIQAAGLHPFDFIHPARLQELANRGTIVHKITELHDTGVLDPESVDPALQGFYDAWLKFRKEFEFEIVKTEEPVCNPTIGYAGTMDRIIKIAGTEYVLDIKTGDYHPSYTAQIAAYTKAVKLDRRIGYCVTIKEDGKYNLSECEVNKGWVLFLSALNIFKFKQQHNIK